MYEKLKELIWNASGEEMYSGVVLSEIERKYNMGLSTEEEYEDLLGYYENILEGWDEEPVFSEFYY